MKPLIAAASLIYCFAYCSRRGITFGASKREMELELEVDRDSKFAPLPTNPSEVNVGDLALFGEHLDEHSLNKAMELMGEKIDGCDKAHLLNISKVMDTPYEELVDHSVAYGLTWFLCSLLYRYNGWETEFKRHVYAAYLYKKDWCPLKDWQNQEKLDWGANYQAIFKADNPTLLRELFINADAFFRKEDGSSISWGGPTKDDVEYIKKHIHRLILHYDSARILEALEGDTEFAKFFGLDGLNGSMRDVMRDSLEGGHKKLYIAGYHRKLRTLLNIPLLYRNFTCHDLEYFLGHGPSEQSMREILSAAFTYDYYWALEMLHKNGLLEAFITKVWINYAFKHGSHKILTWIYHRSHGGEQLTMLRAIFEEQFHICPQMNRYHFLRVHKSTFRDYIPTQSSIDKWAVSGEVLDFLETFEPKLYPSQGAVHSWSNLNLKLRVYKANPGWVVTDDEIRRAIRKDYPDFLEYALGQRAGKIIEGACCWRLIQHNISVDAGYVPSREELEKAFNNDCIEVMKWLYEHKDGDNQYQELYGEYLGRVDKMPKWFSLIRWLWEREKIVPSEKDLMDLVRIQRLEWCKWAWDEHKDEIKKLAGKQVIIEKKELIEWWIENVDKDYTPNILIAFKVCATRHDIDSARWIAERWPFSIKQSELNECYRNYISSCSFVHRIEFIELIHANNERIELDFSFGQDWGCIEERSLPNLKRILAEHVHQPMRLEELEFILNLPDLQGGINLKVLERMMIRGDDKLIELLGRYGHLEGYEEAIEGGGMIRMVK